MKSEIAQPSAGKVSLSKTNCHAEAILVDYIKAFSVEQENPMHTGKFFYMAKIALAKIALAKMALVFVLLASFFGVAQARAASLSEQAATVAQNKDAWPSHLRILTGPNGGQWFMMGDPLAEVLSRDVLSTSNRLGGGVDNIKDVSEKRGEIGFTLSCFLGASDSGEPEYQKLKVDNAVLMANIYPQVLYFLVRKDFATKHKLTDVGSLLRLEEPIRFASLRPGTASEFILDLLLRHGYKTSFEQLRKQGWNISFTNYSETVDNFVDGQIDCFAYTAGTVVPLIKAMETHTDLCILPVNQDVLDLLSAKFKTSTYVIKPGIYKDVTSEVSTLGDYTSFIVRKDLPDDLVFLINKTLWENKDYVARVIEDFGQLSPKTALPGGMPTHPGAEKYWNSLLEKK